MGLFKNLLFGDTENKEVPYNSNLIEGYSQVYYPNKIFDTDKISLNSTIDVYVRELVFDGINVEENNLLYLRYSALLEDSNGYFWGVVAINEPFHIRFVDNKSMNVSRKDNISNRQIFITDVLPVTMSSMFYKDNSEYIFYARNKKGIYYKISLDTKHYLTMEYMRTLLNSKKKISSISAAPIIRLGDIMISKIVMFASDIEFLAFSVNKDLLLILISVNKIKCLGFCSLKNMNNSTINKIKNNNMYIEDMMLYINNLNVVHKETVFMLHNRIECGHINENTNGNNILKSFVFLEDFRIHNEDVPYQAVRFYIPAYESLLAQILNYVRENISLNINPV